MHLQRALTCSGARFRLAACTGALSRAGGAYGNSATISFGRQSIAATKAARIRNVFRVNGRPSSFPSAA